jgi:hypothetical protein
MTKVLVFGTPMILCSNPWAAVGMSAKGHYLRNYAKWMKNKALASDAQKAVWKAFTDVARQSLTAVPPDGTFTTLQKRVKWIGQQLRGKSFGGRPRRRVYARE